MQMMFANKENDLMVLRSRLQNLSEDAYSTKEEVNSIAAELQALKSQLELANENSTTLQVTLAKLTSKVGTYHARAEGAVRSRSCFLQI